MRVISGKLKGRIINGFDIDGTRPTMDRVKESVFAMIQDYLNNSIVLDLFAGSGNLGIEAISNGASKVYFNDKNMKCIRIIQNNLENFNSLNNSVLTNLDYEEALKYYYNKNIKFDLIFLDPPYKEHIIDNIMTLIKKYDLLNNDGLVVCELDNHVDINCDFSIFKEKKYGDKKIIIFNN